MPRTISFDVKSRIFQLVILMLEAGYFHYDQNLLQ